jgi:hypothetical protein
MIAEFHFSLAHFFGDCVVSTASVDQKNFRNGFDSGQTIAASPVDR